MARHEPARRAVPGAPPDMRLKFRRGPDGKIEVVVPEQAPERHDRDDPGPAQQPPDRGADRTRGD